MNEIYVPGYKQQTRNRKALSTKAYVMVFVCPVTRLVNLQVLEAKDDGSVVDAVSRIGCEVGVLSFKNTETSRIPNIIIINIYYYRI